MGDWRYEGDSGYLGQLGASSRASSRSDPWDTGGWQASGWDGERRNGAPRENGSAAGAGDATSGVARRLQGRLDRHVWLLERMQAELYPEPPDFPELQDAARRMRRDTESLLLLVGEEPGVVDNGPRRLGDLVVDAAAAADDPRRVEVRPGPSATIDAAAAVELQHVLAELVDHITAVYPGAWLDLVTRLEPGNGGQGAVVEALVDGAPRHDPDAMGGREAAAAAEQLARRSRHGITLRHPAEGPPASGSGLVASVCCPSAVVTVDAPSRPPVSADGWSDAGYPPHANGHDTGGLPVNGAANGSAVNGSGTNGSVLRSSFGSTHDSLGGEASYPPFQDDTPSEPMPAIKPSASSGVDELFGPLIDLPLEPIDDRYATPIFEAIASAWFQEGEDGAPSSPGGPLDWETPQDEEWREAAARAVRSEPVPVTASGLPQRRPGDQLVPPKVNSSGDPATAAERVPDRVRDRLSTYQRGLREGRHHNGSALDGYDDRHSGDSW